MYELLLRTETLLGGLGPATLLAIGAVALVVGLVFSLGGTRYGTVIIALLGAAVGSAAGLLIAQWLGLHLWASTLVGASVLALLAILLRKVLTLVLAVLIIAAFSGAGYISVILDRMAPPEPDAPTERTVPYQSFRYMESAARFAYMDEIASEQQTFAQRLKALLADTWRAVGPHAWILVVAVVVGAAVALLLVWFIARIVIALACSVVGATAVLIGLQAALLAVNVKVVSALGPRPWLLPISFAVLIFFGWIWQLFFAGPKPKKAPQEHHEQSD